MKKRFFSLAILLMTLLYLPVVGEETAREEVQYIVRSSIEFNIRKEPESEYRVKKVGKDSRLKLYEYGDEWCRVSFEGEVGWAKTDWLFSFHSMDGARFPVPGYKPVIGYVKPLETAFVKAGKFPGIDVQAGNMLFVNEKTENGYNLPVWRADMTLPKDQVEFTPISNVDSALPGDIIAGYTTFFHPKTGGSLAAGRVTNIENGCNRMSGIVVRPGDEFSFNQSCGMYTQGKGYVMGPSINAKGKGMGGGVCQVTTTLYNALITLPVKVTKMEPHRVAGVDYVPVGMDAAVSAFSDLAFENTLPYPVRLEGIPQKGALTVVIYRAEE